MCSVLHILLFCVFVRDCISALSTLTRLCLCSLQQLLYSFDKQVCVSSCSLNKEETMLGEQLYCTDNDLLAALAFNDAGFVTQKQV